MIISASRRCDIPAWRMDWFMEVLAQGWVQVTNPFNAGLTRTVSLLPGDVDCLVFWTRDPRPLLARVDELEAKGMPWYVQVTLTAYPRALEPGAPPSAEVVAAMAALAERLGPRRVVWRYDPIIAAHGLGPAFHEANFAALAGRLAGRVERVVVSLLDEYRSTARRLEAAGHPDPVFASALKGREASPGLPPEPYPAILAAIGRLAALAGMEARACAEPWDLSGFGIGPGACIDAGLVSRISGTSPSAAKDRNQRPDCGCAASVDIGSYGACPTGCVYCYARR